MIGLRVCVVAAVCGVSARAAAAEDVGPAATATTTRPPAVEVTTAKRVRHDWYVGFGFGLGVGNLRPRATGTGTRFGAAILGYVRGGGRITDRIAVGGLVVTALGGGDGAARGLFNVMAEGLFFPVKDRGLALGVALGLSSVFGGRAATDAMAATADPVRGGVGFGLGLGHDFWLTRRFNLGIWLRGDGSGGPKYGVWAAGTLGLAFAWY